jgi:CheY-like chemotaxis protein
VESTVGVGSVFWCELNSAAAPQLESPKRRNRAFPGPPPLPAGAPQRTLLYVEDNPANMKLVEQLIARARTCAADRGERNPRHRAGPRPQPEVILMDINLPGISGIEALKILREDPATAHIPVVALSANAMPRDIAKGPGGGILPLSSPSPSRSKSSWTR